MKVFAKLLVAAALSVAATAAGAQTLRVAMTASDLPTTGGIPDQGGEGGRFAGYTIYDSLVNWDFTQPDKIAGVTPGLATEWHVNPDDHNEWIFTLRQGVKFHDGSDFNADAVIFSLDRTFNSKAANYDAAEAGFITSGLPMVDHYAKLDDQHVAIWTKTPFSVFPFLVTRILITSPTQYEKVGKSWPNYILHPSGTGPFKVTKITPHVSIELARNSDYWDKTRIPKLASMVLYAMPESTTRLAALRSGQVDWIEVPPPDAIPSLKAAGFQISLWHYPHVWPWFLSQAKGSPLQDKRVRQALNYGIDRQGLVKLINGTAEPAAGIYPPDNVYWGSPHENYTYDPAKAKELLKEAGYGPENPVTIKVMITPAGSGQMLPVPMNEYLQQNLKPIGINLNFDVVDWGTMLVAARSPPDAPTSHGDTAMNYSSGYSDPSILYRFFDTASFPPNGNNWTNINNPQIDKLLDQAFATFDDTKRDALLAQVHTIVVDDADWLFVVHDLNPRAMSPKVKGFVPAQSWYQDFTHVTVDK